MKKLLLLIFGITLLASPLAAVVNVLTNADGSRYSAVLVSGSTARKYDIVFIGDGFTAAQQGLFNQAVNDAVAGMRNLSPYRENMCSFNIWLVNVISNESGTDDPNRGINRDTELDTRYGNAANGEAVRCVATASAANCFEAAGHAPAFDAVYVLINDPGSGGCAGGLIISTIARGFESIVTHELGHKVLALADEYDCYRCDGSDANNRYMGGEIPATNLTSILDRATTKWAGLIDAATPLPTLLNNPPGVVGLWEGGGYNRFGLYRPQEVCHMRATWAPFCQVCITAGRNILLGYCGICERNQPACNNIRRLRDNVRLYIYQERFPYSRFPLPPVCLSCPFFDRANVYKYRMVLPGINTQQYKVSIVNGDDKEIAVLTGSEINFERVAKENYFLSITLLDKTLEGKELTIKPQFFENGKQVMNF